MANPADRKYRFNSLVPKIWGGCREELAGYWEMCGEVESSVDVFCPIDLLTWPSGVYILALVAMAVPAIEKHVQEICSAAI